MLAPLLIASLMTCTLLMSVGWIHDRLGRRDESPAACPLFPADSRDPRLSA